MGSIKSVQNLSYKHFLFLIDSFWILFNIKESGNYQRLSSVGKITKHTADKNMISEVKNTLKNVQSLAHTTLIKQQYILLG